MCRCACGLNLLGEAVTVARRVAAACSDPNDEGKSAKKNEAKNYLIFQLGWVQLNQSFSIGGVGGKRFP